MIERLRSEPALVNAAIAAVAALVAKVAFDIEVDGAGIAGFITAVLGSGWLTRSKVIPTRTIDVVPTEWVKEWIVDPELPKYDGPEGE